MPLFFLQISKRWNRRTFAKQIAIVCAGENKGTGKMLAQSAVPMNVFCNVTGRILKNNGECDGLVEKFIKI
jgi:hypothetical protein